MPDVTLRLAQAAALGRHPRGTAPLDTYRHVPGSVLRGALAAAWIRDHGPPQHAAAARREEFLHLFEGPVRYGPLFDPATDVVPLSVLRCKYRPEEGCRTFAADQAAEPEEPLTRPRCTVCGGRSEPGRGDVEFLGPAGTDSGITQTTRAALTDGERAAEGQLFTRRALAGQTGPGRARELTGRIIAPAPERAAWLLGERRLYLGGRRSTSGAAAYLPRRASRPLPDPAALVRHRALVVRLTSPALLVDAAGRPTVHPDEHLIGELLGLGAPVEVERSWIRQEQIGGWHALTNLPKPTELAVSAGSVFRLRLPDLPSAQGLARLADHGLGLRRAEGFGWIELGPWTPRTRSEPEATQTAERSRAELIAHELYELTGEAAWFHDRLRECLLDRRSGNPPDARFLDMPRAEVLNRIDDGALRNRLRRLVEGGIEELEGAVVRLESRLRRGRSR